MARAVLLLVVLAGIVGGRAALGAASDAPAADPVPERRMVAGAAPAELPPLPTGRRATVVEPVAGAGARRKPTTARPDTRAVQAPPLTAPAPRHAASTSAGVALDRPDSTGDGTRRATALPNGIALPPLEAPEAVRRMIEAGNVIARSPYVWGGGHGRWVDTGYDCSGSVSFVLAAAGLLDAPLASGPLMAWGKPGPGRWVTIYANPGHVFMEVAGIRFDTSGRARTGSRWQDAVRTTGGFTARHPAGL